MPTPCTSFKVTLNLFTSLTLLCPLPLLAFPLSHQQDPTAQASPVERKDTKDPLVTKLKNATYRAETGAVKLKDGLFQPGGGASLEGFTQLNVGSVTPAKVLTPNGITAAAILEVNEGGTATMTELHAIRVERGVPRDVAFVNLGDRVNVKSLVVEGSEIQVNMLVHGPEDGACCPTVEKSVIYRLKGTSLVRKEADEEVGELLRQYESALSQTAALEITITLDPQAINAQSQLRDQVEHAKATEKEVLSKIHRLNLIHDPRFQTAVRQRVAQKDSLLSTQNSLTFSRATPGQQRAILFLLDVRNGLNRLLQ